MAAVMKTATATGSVASFWSPKPAAIKSLKVYFEPKQAGEGDPSPDNVRPIEGWTGVDLYKLKINDIVSDIWLSPDGKKAKNSLYNGFRTWSKSWYPTADMIGKTITYSAFINNENAQANSYVHVWTKKSDGSWYRTDIIPSYKGYTFAGSSGISSVTFTIDENMYEIDFGLTLPVGGYAKAPFVELGEYDATKSIKESIEFPENYYGGYVDLISGEIWKTHHHYTFTGDETFYTEGSNWATSFIPPVNGEKMRAYGPSWSGVCTHYPYAPYKKGSIGVMYNENTCTFDSRIRDAEGWKAFAKEQYDAGTPIEVAYLLRDPVLIGTLTPQQLSAFIGRNNFFSNATKVEVEYEYADSPELEVIKKRIALNEPHLGNASGSVASFYTDMASPMKSLKVNFEAEQSGAGDPSPDNVRSITGVDQINVCTSGKNICHIVGYSAKNINTPTATRSLTNNYGTTLSTIDFQLPDSSVVVTQTDHPNTTIYNSYTNGYFTIIEDNMILGKYYNVSFRVTDVTNNPLNASLSDIVIYAPSGGARSPSVDGDRLVYHDFLYKQYASVPTRHGIEVRNCGISFTLSEFMVTEVTEEDQTYESYTGNIIPYNLSELGTQYGGYVDLINGTLTKTWTKLTTTWGELDAPGTVIGNNTRKTFTLPIVGINDEENSIFNAGPYIWSNSQDVPHYYINSTGRVLYVVLPNDTDSSFPIEVAYKLAEPITYQLTPQQIKTFRGTNNIYSFDGTVDVKYWLHSDVKTERKTVMWNQWAF